MATWPWASYLIFLNISGEKKSVGRLQQMWGLNETMHLKYIAQGLAYCIQSGISHYNIRINFLICFSYSSWWCPTIFKHTGSMPFKHSCIWHFPGLWVLTYPRADYSILFFPVSVRGGIVVSTTAFLLYLYNLSLMNSGSRKFNKGRQLKFHVILLWFKII